MVSGLVTSPWDQERIFSGLAREMRMESKSAIRLARSYGLLRYKVVSSLPGFRRGCGPFARTDRLRTLKDNQRLLPAKHCRGYWPLDYKTFRAAGASLVGRFFLRLLALHQFNVKAERLQLANDNVERFRHARLDARLALDDGLVNLGAAINVVGLCREQFLQDVRGAVGFERPNFHFAEALAAELRLAAERLLRNERVGADAARVNLVV